MKKFLPYLIMVLVVLLGAYYFTTSSNEAEEAGEHVPVWTFEGENYSLMVPEGWSSEIQQSGPLGGPFSDVIVLQSPDFAPDLQTDYNVALSGAEIRVWLPRSDEADIDSLSEFTDRYTVLSEPVQNSVVAGEPAITYVWGYEGPILMKTAFVHEKKLYTVTLQAADARRLSDIAKFDLYRSEYELVLNSFKFK